MRHPGIVRLREVVVDVSRFAFPSLYVVKKDSRELPNEFYLVFDFVDNDLAGLIRGINKGLLPPCVFGEVFPLDYPRK